MADETDFVEASVPVTINGVLAYAKGDRVDPATARKLGLTGKKAPTGPISATADTTGILSVASTADIVAGTATLDAETK